MERTVTDDPSFAELVELLNADLAQRDGDDHAFYNQYNSLDKHSRVVLAYDGEKAIGCGAIKPHASGGMEIKRMYTLPEYRGRGVAGQILRELEGWAASDGASRCVLETGKRQPEAIALYEKHGYRRIPNFEPYEGVANSVCFEKLLTPGKDGE